jgi:cysteine synthase B
MVDGLKNIDEGFVPEVFVDNGGEDLLDGRIIVRPRESIEWTRRLTAEAGIFGGISAGAAMAGAAKAAAQLAAHGKAEGVIVVVLADGGWKYLSTGAWTDPIDEVVEKAKKIIYF